MAAETLASGSPVVAPATVVTPATTRLVFAEKTYPQGALSPGLSDVSLTSVAQGPAGELAWFGFLTVQMKPGEGIAFFDKQISYKALPGPYPRFRVRVPLTAKVTRFEMARVYHSGTPHFITFQFTNPHWIEPEGPPDFLSPTPIKYASVSLGATTAVYEEAETSGFSGILSTLKVASGFPLVQGKWDFGGNIFVTLFPLSSSTPDTSVRYLGANIRVGYTVAKWSRYRVALLGGIYYTTMFVSPGNFGFKDLMGPTLFPTFQAYFPQGYFSTYAKYSPVGNGTQISSLNYGELAVGASWTRPLKRQGVMLLSFDLSRLRAQAQGLPISSNSMSLSIGYGY